MKHILLSIALLSLAVPLNAEPDRFTASVPSRVLFIGNSYTYTNMGIPAAMRSVGLNAGLPDTIEFETSLIGGSNLQEHWEAGNAQTKIRQGGWDIVILQTRSTEPLDSAGRENFYTYARLFDFLIDSVGARTGFFMTWPRQTQDTWQVISAAYDSIGTELDAVVVPVGTAFNEVRANRPGINLYSSDGSHPSVYGTWLGGLMFYTSFTKKNPAANGWNPDTSLYTAEEAAYLQGAAWDVLRGYLETPCTDGSAPSVPAGLGGSPVSTSSVTVTWEASTHVACGVRVYRVFRAGEFIGESYIPQYTDGGLLGGTGYAYTVTAVGLNDMESDTSAPVTLTTLLDSVPPQLTAALNTRKPTRVFLEFSEEMDQVSCETAGNYSIDKGITVLDAVLEEDRVTLTTSAMTANETYTVTVTGVKDNASVGNTIEPGAQQSFSYIPLSFMDNAAGYWPFDRSLEDYSPYANNGSWSKDESYGTGNLKQCLILTGDTSCSYVTIPRDDALDGMDSLTISVWAKKADPEVGGYILLMHTAYRLILGATNVSGYLYTSGGSVNFSSTVPSTGDTAWHHYCLTYDGASLQIWVDAVPVDTDSLGGTVADVSRDLVVGKNPWGSALAFNGSIDELRIYDTALDSGGIAALFSDQPYLEGDLDSAAVRSILDRNALGQTVDQVTERDPASGRVLVLDLDSLGMDRITDRVGQLTAMRALYCAGTGDTGLVSIDPAIGSCTALETLILKDNILTFLPDEITALSDLICLDVGGNMLCNPSGTVEAWLDTYDPDWRDGQTGCTGIDPECPVAGVVMMTRPEMRGKLYDLNGSPVTEASPGPGCYLLFDGSQDGPRKILIIR